MMVDVSLFGGRGGAAQGSVVNRSVRGGAHSCVS